MRVLILLVCLSAGCLAQRPQKCSKYNTTDIDEKLMAYARYSYDALGKRIHLREIGSYNNKTFRFDVLLLYRQGVMYKINYRNRTCCKKPLSVDFHPLEIPQNASLLGQVVLGSSSGPGQGVLVNTWAAKYMSTVTEFGCVPVSTLFHTDRSGWVVTSSFILTGKSCPQFFYNSKCKKEIVNILCNFHFLP
uniref:Ependymin n=1 Tax=Dicentrarchus labrax TaxID=13489 RepID=A0A8C4IHZ5_DICLA